MVATPGAPELPMVEEVVEPEPCSQSKVTQAEVDSRYFDLTVSSLADVLHAFDQVSFSLRWKILVFFLLRLVRVCCRGQPAFNVSQQRAALCQESEVSLPKP